MRKKILAYSFLFTCLLCCTSCFEILEEINLDNDGSGTMLVTFNLSKSKTKLASIMMLDSVNGHKVPSEDDIEEALKDVVSHLGKTDGIGSIKTTKDFENYIFTVSCRFNNVSSINGIFRELIEKQNKKGKTSFDTTNFSFDANTCVFQRHFTYDSSIQKSFDHLNHEDKKVFQDARLTTIYRFKTPVKGVSNPRAKVAPNKKAVMLRVSAMGFIKGEEQIANKIQLTK